jgi:hypothetical protein
VGWKDRAKPVIEGSESWKDRAKPVSAPQSNMLEAGIEGLGQGASLGYGNELAAALEQVTFPVASFFTGQDVQADPYLEARDKYEARTKKLEAENPGAYMAGNVGGSIASAIATAPLTTVKGATGLAKLGNAARIGALQGAAMDVDNKKGEYSIGAEDRLKNMAIGGALGGLFQGGTNLMNKAPAALSDTAEGLAARALGAERGTIKSIGYDKVKEAGRTALDEGILSPLASTDDLISRTQALKNKGGEAMGEVYSAIDNAGASTFNPLDTAVKVEDKIGGFYRSPINRGQTSQLENTLESISMLGDKPIGLQQAQQLKQDLGNVANWKNTLNPTEKELMARDAYRVVSQEIDTAVEHGANKIATPGLLEKLQSGKDLFSKTSTMEKMLENKQARESGNKLMGLTDWELAGGGLAGTLAGAATGGAGVVATGAALLAKKGLEKYGAQTGALALDKISKSLLKSPQWMKVAKDNPQVFNQFVTQMVSQMENKKQTQNVAIQSTQPLNNKEEILNKTSNSKYAQVMQQAAEKGSHSLAAANYVLSQRDPNYRKVIEGEEQ